MDGRHPLPKPISISDPLIIPRVKQYLEENVHQTYVDVGVMARHLQEKYREYGRRKHQPFRYLVDQAYKTVLHSYGLDSNPSTEEEENSDLELMEDPPLQSNHMNNMLTDMYRTNANESRGPTTQNDFPIDISSDESDVDDTVPKSANNGHASKEFSKVPKDIVLGSISKITAAAETLAGIREESMKSKSALSTTAPSTALSPVTTTKKRKLEAISFDSGSDRNVPRHPTTRQTSKKFKKEFTVKKSEYTFESIGGIDKILRELCELLLHVNNPNVYKRIGLPAPRGFLLHGPPGSGKTLLAQAIAGQLNVGLIQVAGTELVSGVSGESEERIRDLFEQAALCAPCVLFIDEIDSISANRKNASKDMERRIVAQLLTSLDDLPKLDGGDQVLVIGATNRADSLDPSIRRVGRFDQEICLGIPDRDARCEILRIICKSLRLESFFDFDLIASLTPGFVGADLLALATRAGLLAIKKLLHDKQEHALKESATKVDKPSSTVTPEVNEMNLEDGIFMQIDSELPQHKNDEEESVNSPSNAGPMDVTNASKEKDENQENPENQSSKVVPDANTESHVNQTDTSVKSLGTNNANDAKNDGVVKSSDDSNPNGTEADSAVKMDNGANFPMVVETTSTNETLGEALLKNNAIKDRMGLDVMFKWLSHQDKLVTEEDLNELYVTVDNFKEAVKLVQPSAKREGFITVPDVTWDDIGSLRDIREELNLAILAPVKFPNRLKTLGINAPSGVLLCGPPGCGKTLLAKAIANEAGINFISVKGPELLNMYVGESERAVRQCFHRGRNSAPCVIFFDEFDALCPKRSGASGDSQARVVNQLLTEMDGIEERKGVFIMAASNRPDMIDPAVLRPGRLDKILYVGLPEKHDRFEILQAQTKQGKQPILDDDVNLEELAQLTDSFTGADLAGLVRQASLQALRDSLKFETTNETEIDLTVHKQHFMLALQHMRPSVSTEDKVQYELLRLKYASTADK
ncbi:nuclear valosin-containing protein-like isoform X1 [Sitodiplosis mosellana]|nr:nuclear valosin-containing protein-like isoform X1 [Sitodiplosis mosellana]XP_055315334.1 nuclear valosin-containing protein-like isoform X1 [Sitodiplosis mosellana]